MQLCKKYVAVVFFLLASNLLVAQMHTVKTQNGLIAGSSSNGINIFKGIPFAAPPVAALRWKEPQPVANWKGVKQCTAFSASPVQPKPVPFLCWSEEFIAPPEPLNEDCLYLNIWTAAKNKKEIRPVFVWIYGGGFNSGSAACAIYDGEEMAKRGIVFVSINYRVGAFGFMAHPQLSAEQNNASGNYGILDQIAALKWIQKNIGAFGGDPSRITIAGQSAGSMSVNSLVASPLAKGLFQQAILQSGGLVGSFRPATLSSAEAIGNEMQKKLGATDINEMRKKSADEILAASQSLGNLRMGLTLDDYVLPKNLLAHFKEGKHNNVPLMMGWVTGDGALFGKSTITADKYVQQANEKYGTDAVAYLKLFTANTDEEAQQSESKMTLLNFAVLPAHLLAVYNNKPSFMYQVSHVPTDKPGFPNYGAFHTSEVPYALHTLHLWKRPWQKHDYEVEQLMSNYWIQFIKTGNPNGNSLPNWKVYNKDEGEILEIDNKAIIRPGLLKLEIELLEKLEKKD